MKYLIYTRVSPKGSTWAGGETSVKTQETACKDFILLRDPAAEFIVVTDELVSGKSLKRPGVQRVIADLKSPAAGWDCLVVFHLDRLTRSLNDAMPIFQLLRDNGRGFISIQQNLDMFTAGGRAMLYILTVFAQFEREMNSERTSAKMRQICRDGGIPYGMPPFGYFRAGKKQNIIEADPQKIPVVKDIFQSYNSGVSTDELFKRHRSWFKSKQTIINILRTKLYTGVIAYGGAEYEGKHQPVITPEEFMRAQSRLPGKRKADRLNARTYPYLLSGLVYCHCGKHMTNYSVLKKGERFHYYKCTDVMCRNAVNAKRLDDVAFGALKDLSIDAAEVRQICAEYNGRRADKLKATEPELQSFETEIAALRARQKSVMDVFLSGKVTDDNKLFWNEQLSSINRQLSIQEAGKDSLLRQMKNTVNIFDPDAIIGHLSYWKKMAEDCADDTETKRNFMLARIERIDSHKNNDFKLSLVMTKKESWLPDEHLVITRFIKIPKGKIIPVGSRNSSSI